MNLLKTNQNAALILYGGAMRVRVELNQYGGFWIVWKSKSRLFLVVWRTLLWLLNVTRNNMNNANPTSYYSTLLRARVLQFEILSAISKYT